MNVDNLENSKNDEKTSKRQRLTQHAQRRKQLVKLKFGVVCEL